jgi:hypothetical protein
MSKFAAKGSLLKYLVGSTTYTTIANQKGFSLGFGEAELIDASSMDQASGFKEYVLGLKDCPEISLGLQWDPSLASHAAMLAALGGAALTFKAVFSDTGAAEAAFSGLVRSIEVTTDLTGTLDAVVKIKPTGTVTVTP